MLVREIQNKVINSGLYITFITTEDCNFRCPYCYEEHKNNFITQDIYDDVRRGEQNDCERAQNGTQTAGRFMLHQHPNPREISKR